VAKVLPLGYVKILQLLVCSAGLFQEPVDDVRGVNAIFVTLLANVQDTLMDFRRGKKDE
jgi:hypothetical protein